MKSKVLLSFFAMLVVVLVTFSTNALATENLVKDLGVDSLKEQALLEIKMEYPEATFVDLTIEEYEKLQKENFKSNNNIGIFGPAPPLTDVDIFALTSDGNNYIWEYLDYGQSFANTPLHGDYGYMAIYIEGYTINSYVINNNGTNKTNQTFRALDPDYLAGPDGIIYGRIEYIGFPLDTFNSGSITALFRSYDNILNTKSDTVNVQIQ